MEDRRIVIQRPSRIICWIEPAHCHLKKFHWLVKMKIWKKTVAIIIVSVVVMILLNMMALSYFVGNDIHQTETREAQNLLNRGSNAVTSEVGSLGVDCFNWAVWDDTYSFVQNPQPRIHRCKP